MRSREKTVESESSLQMAEKYKMLRNNIQYMNTDSDIKSILITSTKEGEGKTTTAVNLAMTMARSGKKTLLVDCDFNSSCIHKLFNVFNDTGVITIFKKDSYSRPAISKSNVENLYILPSGTNSCSSAEIFLSEKIEELLNDVKSEYDFVIIDASAIMNISDVQIISRYVDGCVLVVREGDADIEELKLAKDALDKVNAKILGAVFNKVDNRKQNAIHICQPENEKNKEKNNKKENKFLKYFGGKKVKVATRALVLMIILTLCIQISGSTAYASDTLSSQISSPTSNEEADESNIITSFDIEGWKDEVEFNENEKTLSTNSTDRDAFQNGQSKEEKVNSQFGNIISQHARIQARFPLVAKQYCPVFIKIFSNANLTLKIVGDNDFSETPYKFLHCKNIWVWKPQHSGIFKMILYKNGQAIAERKVYVNSHNNKYLQFNELKATEKNGVTHIQAKLKNSRPSGFDDEPINKDMKFTIGESCVWSKTIKNYGDSVFKINKNLYDINEDREDFKFNTGIYSITAFLKSSRSIEYEDAKQIKYKKSGLDNLELKLQGTPDKEEENGKYPEETTFDFEATVTDNLGADLEYMFLIWDKRGKKVIKQYSSDNTFQWQGAHPGKYVIYARVKQAGNANDYLPNSYEAEVAYPVEIYGNNTSNIKINNVCIGPYKTIKSHEMNYITINASNGNCTGNLMYKAYAIHDGYWRKLSDYSRFNVIPFYPKSYGEYKIIVLVKDKDSDSENASYEATFNVK